MKIVSKDQFNHTQLTGQKTGEVYSLSAVVSQLLESKQLFVHHDIIAPGNKSSGPHRHTIIEEAVYIVKGTATVVEGKNEVVAEEGTLVLFDPKGKETHFLFNRTDQNVETITFSINSEFDSVVCNQPTEDVQRPSSHFDQDLRDVPDNIGEWKVFVDGLKAQLKDENHSAKKLMLLEHIGMAARTLLKFDEAEFYLKKALTLSYSYPSQSRLIQNLIRLAHVYQWKKEFDKSQMLFDQAKSLIDENPVSEVLRAAYHQHVGKLCFDQQFFGKAQAEFSTALSIREKIAAPNDQIESSQDSLKEALKRWGRNFSGTYVRKAIPQDAESIHRAHMKSIQEICSKDHSPQEIQAWGHRPYREDQRVGSVKNDLVWVVENNGSIEGYGHLKIFEKDGLKRGQIFGLYLTPEVVGKSLGKAIVDLMMEEIKSAKVKQVSLEATITAQNFYRKVGFVDAGPETTVEISGTPIRCYPMKMEL
ncbi:MAG: GNAT family N-acetyltransferase [Bdellovibrionaceae bacterium]|nr:GNAT family N-acetyltransferase [Pseudobdellovibrionaceae bacterium]